MTRARTSSLLRHLRQCAGVPDANPLSDRELLQRFTAERDEAAFTALVQRHGPMVVSVCRRLLPRPQDVEDAFQATFLVLIRKASSSFWRESVGGWLHHVAVHVALRMRADAARRTIEARRTEESVIADPLEQMTARELLDAFDEELTRLPDTYREPLVLCHLEGQTQEAAARHLGLSLSTVRRRLERGRNLLHARLTRRGLALPAALGIGTSIATVPAPLRATVLRAMNGSVSARVAVVADGVLKASVLTPMKVSAAVLVALSVLASGRLVASHFLAVKPPEIPASASTPSEKPKGEKAERTDLYGDPLPPGALMRMGTVRFRNRDLIGNIAFSPDGKVVAAGGYGGSIFLYDAMTGRRRRQFQALTGQFTGLAFAPDGETLATASSQTIQIWNLATGKEHRRFGVKAAQRSEDYDFRLIVPLIFSHTGKALAWVAPDRSVRIWDANSGKELTKLSGHQKPIRYLAFSPDDKTLISADGQGWGVDGLVCVWDVAAGRQLRQFPLRSGEAQGQPGTPLSISPDSKMLAFEAHKILHRRGAPNANILDWQVVSLVDVATGEVRRKLEPQRGRFKAAAFSPDGKLLATMHGVRTIVGNHQSEDNNRIQVWEAATGKQLFDFPAYAEHFPQGPCCLAFSPDGKKLAAAATASALHVWDVVRGREDQERTETHHDWVRCVAYSPDGRTLASAGSDHDIVLWDAATGRQRLRLRGHEGEVASLAFAPNGKLLASASHFSDQTVRLWDVATGEELRQYVVPSVPEGNGTFMGVSVWVAFTANGKVLAAGGTDRKLRLWDTATGRELFNQEIRSLPVRSKDGPSSPNAWKEYVSNVAFTPDGRVMALSIYQTTYVVDVASNQRLVHFEKAGVLSLSPDGKTLACSGTGGSLRLVEVASGKDLHKIDLPETEDIHARAFSPDGRCLAVAADRSHNKIYVFDVRTGAKLLRLRGHDSYVGDLAFSPDGTKLASGQWDSTALIWDVSAARPKLPAKNLALRDLERLWADLKDADAPKAHAALWTLAGAPDQALPFLQEHLRPVPRVVAERLRRLLADLDADDFAQREEASRELTKLGIEVEPALRRLIDGKPALEVRRRVEALLCELPCQTAMTPDALRQLRAIQVLEQIGSAEARQILSVLAEGAPAVPATRDAKAALTRLAAGAGHPPSSRH
jgi:RNA polymerase sigma factor (sigma-70 family)